MQASRFKVQTDLIIEKMSKFKSKLEMQIFVRHLRSLKMSKLGNLVCKNKRRSLMTWSGTVKLWITQYKFIIPRISALAKFGKIASHCPRECVCKFAKNDFVTTFYKLSSINFKIIWVHISVLLRKIHR